MKTQETSNQSHLLNYGFDAPFDIDARTIHVQFNKTTGNVETVQAIGFSQQKNSNYADVTDRLSKGRIAGLKKIAIRHYKAQYGHLPHQQPKVA